MFNREVSQEDILKLASLFKIVVPEAFSPGQDRDTSAVEAGV
jgi:hypothetical protein